jgi:hypothetical protein
MLKDSALIGFLSIFRQVVRPFNNKQIELIRSFAGNTIGIRSCPSGNVSIRSF